MLWMFFCYGLLGWVLETAYAALRQRRYVDRSVLFGPLCLSYGLTGAVLTWGLWELRGRYFFLFLGCAVGATVVEWAAGHLLERATHTRWWDYSARRFNLDGYICAGASAVWGLLGLAAVQWVSPLLVSLYRLLPPLAGHILLWVLVGVLLVDGLGTILTLAGVRETLPQMEAVNSRLAALSIRMGETAPLRRGNIAFYLVLFLLCVLTVAGFLPHPALLAVVGLLLLWRNRGLFVRIDYSLILTFVFFFIFVGNLKQLDALQTWIGGAMAGRDRLIGVLVSQVISNVPAAMLLSGYSSDLRELIVGVNVGGLGTLIASMASLISYKQVAGQYPSLRKRYLILFTLLNLGFLVLLYLI